MAQLTNQAENRALQGVEVPAAGTYEIDQSHSSVEFVGRHLMLTKVRGRFVRFEGRITVADDPLQSEAHVVIDAASVDTGDAQRDAHLRGEDFLDAERYPTFTFKSSRVERTGEDELRVSGDLTIRGVTREVTLDTTYNGRGTNPWGKEVVGFTAETRINRKDFGLTWNVALETGGLLVGDKLDILIEIQAVKQD